ncbi:TRAP transporter large permease [Falsigemmobacter faecalis]|uniref:TRAP transporter large permease protein n=1 Tax=Falsigemmobacter faecalis TaxID=2488730 RepID=A0A3P3D5Y6_9RHOB|nr:TRAP transporter large permease subunit [Falsigemmobacter faecalis]RRH69769.1 TRAP transporter large permease subunit [Falsigemmobacter faecalis]
MSLELITLLLFGGLLVLLMLGTPLSFALGGLSSVFLYATWGPEGFFMVGSRLWSTMGSFTLISIPMFVLMALILERTGVARALYRMMHLWVGGLPGGLAIGTVLICTIFASMVGISGAAVVAMGAVALPAMLSRGYDKELALGCINAGGGLGVLIPPSVLMIIYSMNTGASVGKLFAAGMLPGLLLAVLVALYIAIRCYFQPQLGPALPKEQRGSWPEKFAALRAVFLPLLIVAMVLGSILGGLATLTESAALGVLGALLSSVLDRSFSWKMLQEAMVKTLHITAMIMWIFIGAHVFNTAYNAMGAQSLIMTLMQDIPGGYWGSLFVMLLIVFLMGLVLDPVGIMLITLPVFMPVVKQYGIDPIWFGALFVIALEIGYMTPPFGFNLFYLRGVAPPEITMGDIYRSVWPYVMVVFLGLFLVAMFPAIALWLPSVLF